jgi:hypothetical protein
VAGLRAAILCGALVLAMLTPWALRAAVVTGTLLLVLHLVEQPPWR